MRPSLSRRRICPPHSTELPPSPATQIAAAQRSRNGTSGHCQRSARSPTTPIPAISAIASRAARRQSAIPHSPSAAAANAHAVENVQDICEIEGLSGILIGPGDLSSSYGRPGDFENPELIRDTTRCIQAARDCGKHAGIVAGPGPLLDAALEAGCDLAFVGSDASSLATSWAQLLQTVTGSKLRPASAARQY